MASAPAPPPRRVVVCGGGVVGACTAYFLSTHPASPTMPTLVEKSSPACAASGKAGGFLALDWSDSTPALSALARASFGLHRRLAAALDGANAYGFRPVHTLSICLPSQPAEPVTPPAPPFLGRPLRLRRAAAPARNSGHHRAGPSGPLHQGRPRRVRRRGGHRRGGARGGQRRACRRRRGEGARRGGRGCRGARARPLVWAFRDGQRGVRRVRAQGAQHRAPAAQPRQDHAALPVPELPAGARRQDARPGGLPAPHGGGVHLRNEQGRGCSR
ncbi:hypothetical protein VPH35_028868 [Triticum aestivum]